ncbi:MAG TPA: universal stress protein [Chloroflexi bacterium]|nr:universal stress protein [Chloroflexota bacterium]
MFNKILLATDGSENAAQALEYAKGLAKCHRAKVFVVYVFPKVPDFLGEPSYSNALSKNIARGEEIIADLLHKLQEAGLEVKSEILEGPPADAILRVADVRQCDLIVMGNRGHGQVSSLLVGSVSHKVIAHAKVPVLIARSVEEESAA